MIDGAPQTRRGLRRPRMDIRVQGYANQVKLFLVLLVLFLVASGAVGLNVLSRSRALLIEEARSRITSTSRAVQREITESGLPGRLDRGVDATLSDLARAYSVASIEIVDLDGRILAGTQPWRVGVIDPEAADVARAGLAAMAGGGAVIREPALPTTEAARDADDSEYGPDRGEVLVFLPLQPGAAGPGLLLATGHEVIGVRTIARQIRQLAWTQAIAGLVVLGLVVLFVRWVLRPYRALRQTASRLEANQTPGDLDEPEDLISSFRGVIDKLEEQAAELERMRAAASRGSPGALGQEMLDGLTSGVLIVGSDRRVKELNPAGERILGANRAETIGRDYRDVFASSRELLDILEDGIERGRPHSREVVPYSLHATDSQAPPSHLGVTTSSLPGPAGPGGAFCLFSDLTEIRGLQERVRLRENLAGLGTMSAGIAHEFRNSLATILGYARLIDRDGGSEHAAAIAREVQSIGRVVDEFLRFARPATLQATEWDPRAAMAAVAEETARDLSRPGVEIVIAGDWPRTIRADEGLLRQAFGNLLRNAVEAIPGETGLVMVTGCLDEGRQLRIEVTDTGSGIPAEVVGRLFTPFVTTKDKGTGLGLALAQKAIVCHDGAITARNVESGGACFSIVLPTTQARELPD